MLVNRVVFLTTLSRKLRLVTAEYVHTCTTKQVGRSLTEVANLHARGGFLLNVILIDQGFDKVKNEVRLVAINTTAAMVPAPNVRTR